MELWLLMKLNLYLRQHPRVINWAYNKARVFVPNRPGVTIPEPDVAAYRDFPLETAADRPPAPRQALGDSSVSLRRHVHDEAAAGL